MKFGFLQGMLVTIAVLATNCLSQPSNLSIPMIVAHRGASHDAPENTMASARLGWAQGADAVEIDVYLTPDQRLVVIHDKNTLRTAGVSHVAAQTDSKTLRSLDVGLWKSPDFRGEKIPFLEEVVDAIPPGKQLFIEIKGGAEAVPYLKKILESSGKISQCTLISFQFEALVEARKVMPTIPMYFLLGEVKFEELSTLIARVQENKLQGLNLGYRTITPELVKVCKQNRMPLAAWTVDDVAEAKRLLDLGVIAITTNVPAVMVKNFHNPK
jgi:glycerophosphoryl diester phosphodiesterase